ncbi:MAG: hypothetical protein AAFX06_21755 [Planctomycetota bacterium]
MRIINLNDASDTNNVDYLVWTKPTWASDWIRNDRLIVEDVTMAIAPEISTASLQYRWGTIHDDSGTRQSQPITVRGYFVLIVIPTIDGGYQSWLGYADSPVAIEEDAVSGVQRIPCFGFDRALQYAQITTTVHVDPADSQAWQRRDLGGVFNRQLKGNRSAAKVKYTPASGEANIYAFANPDEDDQEWWSTRTAAEHLVRFHLPTSGYQVSDIPWAMKGLEYLPDWDRPELETEDRSIHECLSELLSDDRLIGWRVTPNVTVDTNAQLQLVPTVLSVDIEAFSLVGTAVNFAPIGGVPANGDLIVWLDADDELSESVVHEDDGDTVDQVIVRGPREIAVGTFRFGTEWVPGWAPEQLTQYSETVSGQPFWGGLSILKKREVNQFVRSRPELDDVYRLFPINPDWDGTCDGDPLFLQENDETFVPYLGNCEILDRLPFYRGVDYAGSASDVDETKGRNTLPLLAWFERPDDPGRYVAIQSLASEVGAPNLRNPNGLKYGIAVRPYFDRGPGFELDVLGAPQHAHRPPGGFVGNDADPIKSNPRIWGEYDSEKMLITAAMRGNRRPEARVPDTVSGDFVRRLHITLEHPGLQHVQVAAATVVDINHFGDAVTSDGGTLRDTVPILSVLARLAADRFLASKKMVTIKTGRSVNLRPGALLRNVNGQLVDTIVRSIRYATPVAESDSPSPFTMMIEASHNTIDIANLVGRVPEPEEPDV